MKKLFMWCGGVALFLVAIFILSILYGSWDRRGWDDFTKDHAKFVVERLDKLNKEQFYEYWGGELPGTEEERKEFFAYAATFGELESINEIELVHYNSKVSFTGKGISHQYIYDVKTEYTNRPAIFRLWLKTNGDQLDVMNLHLSSTEDM